MTAQEDKVFLDALTARLQELEQLLGEEWPQFRELLVSIERRIAETSDPIEVAEGVDDIVDLFLDTAAAELIRGILAQAVAEAGSGANLRRDARLAPPADSAVLVSEAAVAGRAALDRLDPFPVNDTTIVPILYATDRLAAAKGFYGSERGSLEFGVAAVSVPTDKRLGSLPRPRWWKLELAPNPSRHVVVLSVERRDHQIFVENLRRALSDGPELGVLVYIHGYNTTFVDAARRAAQLAYDLAYSGITLLYSWPSVGRLLRYAVDETNVGWSQPHLEGVLRLLLKEAGPDRVDIIAHSMGNRALLGALRALDLPSDADPLRHLVMAAPDVDAETFREMSVEFKGRARRFTLYASSRDWALRCSRRWHGYPRAGESGEALVVVRPVLDTVDASSVDTSLLGHSYCGDNRSIVSDIVALFQHDDAPPRFGMIQREIAAGEYWVFRP